MPESTRTRVVPPFNICDPQTWPDAYLLNPDGSVRPVKPVTESMGFGLDELYSLLECDMIEVVHPQPFHRTGYMLVCDEEGWLKEGAVEKYSPTASVWYAGCKARPEMGYGIVGKVLVCKDRMVK